MISIRAGWASARITCGSLTRTPPDVEGASVMPPLSMVQGQHRTRPSRHLELLVPEAGDRLAGGARVPRSLAGINRERLLGGRRNVGGRLTAVVSMHRSGRPRAEGRRTPDGNAEQPF